MAVSIPITQENAGQIEPLLARLAQYHTQRIVCFVPHSEGRGQLLDPVRLSAQDYANLSETIRSRINTTRFKPEGDWLKQGFPVSEKRVLTVTLRPDNIDFF